MNKSFIFIYVTCPNKKLALKIADQLLRKKWIACANILPQMESLYRWQGRLQKDREVILILKTKKALFEKVEKLVLKLHVYECPCIVALPISQGTKKYLNWLDAETR